MATEKVAHLRATKVKDVYYCVESVKMDGFTVPRNSMVFRGRDYVFVCDRLPKYYEGENPYLYCWVYDREFRCWDKIQCRNACTRAMFKAWSDGGRKYSRYDDIVPANHPVRKHKHGNGSSRDHVNAITDYSCGKRANSSFLCRAQAYEV